MEIPQNMIDEFEDDGIEKADLVRIGELLAEAATLQERIEASKRQTKRLEEALDELLKDTLPDIFQELGMSAFQASDGTVVSVEDFMAASIPKDKRDRAMTWLEDNGHGDIIKLQLSALLQRGDLGRAHEAQQALSSVGVMSTIDKNVHPQTFKKFARELYEEGEELPDDTFNVHMWRQAVIKAT